MNDGDSFARALVEAAPDAFVVLDAERRVHLVNALAEVMLGCPRERLVGRQVEALLHPSGGSVEVLFTERRTPRTGDALPPRTVEVELLRLDGEAVPVEVSVADLSLGAGRFTILVLRDMAERRALEQQLRYRSTHDALTGLENRGAFDEALQRFAVRGPLPVGVLMVDLDGLKTVNDRFGHAAGDELLQRAARCLRESFRAEDVVARIGGDEFAVLAPGQDARAVSLMTARFEEHLRRLNEAEPLVPLRVSMGFSVASAPEALPQAVREADALMYREKRTHHA